MLRINRLDLRRSDVGLLVALDAMLAERGVTAAAQRLGLSQPALSAQLARLRQLFRDDLLVGNAHGMTLTPRAQQIRGPLHALLGELHALVFDEAPFDPTVHQRTFRIAGSDLAHAILMPRLFAALVRLSARITVEAVPLALNDLSQAMEQGEIDFAMTSGENAPEGFPARKLVDDGFCVVWRKDHPVLKGQISQDQFCTLGHLLVTIGGSGLLDDVDHRLHALGLTRQIAGTVPNFLLVPPIIRSTDHIAVIPRLLVQIDTIGIRSAALPFETSPYTAYLSWHPRMKNDSAHRWLRDLIPSMQER